MISVCFLSFCASLPRMTGRESVKQMESCLLYSMDLKSKSQKKNINFTPGSSKRVIVIIIIIIIIHIVQL